MIYFNHPSKRRILNLTQKKYFFSFSNLIFFNIFLNFFWFVWKMKKRILYVKNVDCLKDKKRVVWEFGKRILMNKRILLFMRVRKKKHLLLSNQGLLHVLYLL